MGSIVGKYSTTSTTSMGTSPAETPTIRTEPRDAPAARAKDELAMTGILPFPLARRNPRVPRLVSLPKENHAALSPS